MEKEVHFLKDRLPSENHVVKIVYDRVHITFENILLESIRSTQTEPVDNDFEDWNKNVSSGIEKVKSQVLKVDIQAL